MRLPKFLFIHAVVLAASVPLLCGCGKPATHWEYKVVTANDDEEYLNADYFQRHINDGISDSVANKKTGSVLDKNRERHGQFLLLEDQISGIGTNGWEMVSSEYIPAEHPKLLLLFKRPTK